MAGFKQVTTSGKNRSEAWKRRVHPANQSVGLRQQIRAVLLLVSLVDHCLLRARSTTSDQSRGFERMRSLFLQSGTDGLDVFDDSAIRSETQRPAHLFLEFLHTTLFERDPSLPVPLDALASGRIDGRDFLSVWHQCFCSITYPAGGGGVASCSCFCFGGFNHGCSGFPGKAYSHACCPAILLPS